MSIINVTRMWSKTGGSFTSERYDPFSNKFSMSEGYTVLVDSVEDESPLIVTAAGIPRWGDRHPSGVDAFCNSITPQRISPILWQVGIGYEGVTFDETVEIEWGDTSSTEPIDRDYDGRAIVTVNGEPIDGLSMEIADNIVVIRRKFFFIDTYAIAMYRHSVNSDTFLGWPPGTAKLVGYSAKNQFKRGAPLEMWDVTARIQFRWPLMGATEEQAWYKRYRHEGLYVKTLPTDSPLTAYRAPDGNGQESAKPVLIKIDGTKETNPDNALFIYSKIYGALPYSGMGLL